jgi:hypothetical protein
MFHSPNRLVGVVFGAIYLVVGIFGFFFTSTVAFAAISNSVRLIGIFEVNPLLNLVHLFFGVVLLICGLAGPQAARVGNSAIGGLLLVLCIVGLFIAGTSANFFAVNAGDNALHAITAVMLLGLGFAADRIPARKPAV